jgi:hypothetical protein
VKPWQVVLIVLFAVLGVALIVYFVTRPSSPSDGSDEDENGMMDSEAADTVEGVGNLATGLAAGITRLAT